MAGVKADPATEFPPEVFLQFADASDLPDVAKMIQVSRRWRDLLEEYYGERCKGQLIATRINLSPDLDRLINIGSLELREWQGWRRIMLRTAYNSQPRCAIGVATCSLDTTDGAYKVVGTREGTLFFFSADSSVLFGRVNVTTHKIFRIMQLWDGRLLTLSEDFVVRVFTIEDVASWEGVDYDPDEDLTTPYQTLPTMELERERLISRCVAGGQHNHSLGLPVGRR